MEAWSKLVVCEKGEVARAVAGALIGPDAKAFEGRPQPYVGGGWCVVACSGHLMRLKEPGEIDPKWADRWNEDALPIVVKRWPKVPDERTARAFARVTSLAPKAETIVHAGDPDNEGQGIVDDVLEAAGVDPYGDNVVRALVNNNLPEEIRKEIARARPNREFRPMALCAYARQVGDFVCGVNESRLLAIRTGVASDAVGRVQAPTLGLLVGRQRAIERHRERTYHELLGWVEVEEGGTPLSVPFKLAPGKEMLAGERHVFDRDRVVEAKAAWDRTEVAETVWTATAKEERPPLPFSLLTLTKEMSARHGIGPDAVLSATQRLRDEYRAITYNRTDCEYLEDGHFDEAPATLPTAAKNCGIDLSSWPVSFEERSRCFDSSKVSAHHAIIPQNAEVDLSKLDRDERAVYTAVVERYAMQFMPPRRYEVVSCAIPLEGFGEMRAQWTREVAHGWRAAFPRKQAGNGGAGPKVPPVSPGPHASRRADSPASEICEGKTSPPEPYTEATLMVDMANVAKYVRDPKLRDALLRKDAGKRSENGSIGTPATRAQIIDRLKEVGYARLEGRRIVPTKRGCALYDALPAELKGPELTARWQLMLDEVAEGRRDPDCIADSAVECFERHFADAYRNVALPRDDAVPVGSCPRCGKPAVYREGKTKDGRAWATVDCTSNVRAKRDGKRTLTAGCGWEQSAVVAGKKLAQRTVAALLADGRTSVLKGFRRRDGKPFDAALVLGKDGKFGFAPRRKRG